MVWYLPSSGQHSRHVPTVHLKGRVQWICSNLDTVGPLERVLIRELLSFQWVNIVETSNMDTLGPIEYALTREARGHHCREQIMLVSLKLRLSQSLS